MAPQARAAAAADFTSSDLHRLRCYMTVAGLRSASFYLAGARGPELDLMIDHLRAMPTAPASIKELLPAEPEPQIGSAANIQIWIDSKDELYLLPDGPDGSSRIDFERIEDE